MKTINVAILLAMAAAITPALHAKPLDCAILKQSIEAKLKAHGVGSYTLEAVEMSAPAIGKEIGSCDGGKRKIVYVNLLKRDTATPTDKVFRAPRALVDDDRMRGIDTAALIDSLRTRRNRDLYYSWSAMPSNVRELARRPGDVAALVEACDKKNQDELFRFNVLLILNHKLSGKRDLDTGGNPTSEQGREFHGLNSEEKKAIGDCLVRSLRDVSAMVRTEAVWGLGFLQDPSHEAAVLPLLQDRDANVVKEATTTIAHIRGKLRQGE
ncbi:hypothetical protein BH11PSE11_BH11PSE11_06070 [soil metagenome]